MKLLTLVVPCYNSASYMRRCVDSMLPCGNELDILLIDDGSTDETGTIADEYAAKHPDCVRVIHQENGGHGEGLNQGIRHALGLYLKSVDSDDRLDTPSLMKMLDLLRAHTDEPDQLDLIVNDYVYDRQDEPCCFSVSYRGQLDPDTVMTWDTVRSFPIWKQFMIHSLTYRTQLLRDMGLELPKHTFYEDNLYIYQPLPYVKKIAYLTEPLYGYFIGRADQSVNDGMLLRRLDQVTAICEKMVTSYPYETLRAQPKKLRRYMMNNLAGQLFTTSAVQYLSGESGVQKNREMWERIRTFDPVLFKKLRSHPLGFFTVLPGRAGRRLLVFAYQTGRKMIRF